MKLTCNQLMILAALYRGSSLKGVVTETFCNDMAYLREAEGLVEWRASLQAYAITEKGVARVKAALDVELPPELKPFSVMLLYPQYLWDDEPDTYYAHVVAESADKALEAARLEAAIASGYESLCCDPACNPKDFRCVSIIEGHHEIVL